MVAFAFRVAELEFSFLVRVCACVCVRALGGEMRCVLETYGSEVEVVLLLLNSRIGWQM